MIPKKIHYCWFGGNPKPKLAKKCIKSWKKFCPDYEIIEWNEENFDISSCPLYVRQAYEAKKWAFVTDYVRLQIIYAKGGIYFDTDVEIIKPLDDLLRYSAFFGFEDKFIATGLGFGAEKGIELLKELMDDYKDIPFLLPDGTFDITVCPKRNTNVFLKHGLIQNNTLQIIDDNIVILPPSYLCPIDYSSGVKKISSDTISIHHFSASWKPKEEKDKHIQNIRLVKKNNFIHSLTHIPHRIARFLLGQNVYGYIKKKFK